MAADLLGDNVQPAWKNVARQLALEIVARRETPISDALWKQVRPYLAAKDIPRESRQQAAAGLMRSCNAAGPRAREILESYVSATSKHRAVERLRELEQRIGQSPVLDEFTRHVEDLVRMTCPRCQTQLERRAMIDHLWQKHRLLLEGRRVREPWRVLADWVVDYGLEKDPALLQRCRDLAMKTDPIEGLARLQRLLLRQGIEDREAWNTLLARTRERGGSLCPHCFAHVPLTGAAPPVPLTGADRLLDHGYRVQIYDRGLRPHLQIETPQGMLYDGEEPATALTRLGAVLALAAPLVLAAFGMLYFFLGPTLMLIVMGLGSSLFLGGLVYFFWPQRPLRKRLLASAWDVLVPELLGQTLDDDRSAFLGSLAASTMGQFAPDDDVLLECLTAVQRLPTQSATLAALCRLQLALAIEAGDDAVPLLVERIGQALTGELPLRVVGHVVADLLEHWPRGRLLRLHALVSARIVDAGLDASDLADVNRAQPSLRPLLGSGEGDHRDQLRLFWALRTRWPAWLRDAENVFDLAQDPANEKLLGDRPDLLLLSRDAPIYVGTRGVWLKDICLTERPAQVAVVASRWQEGDGYEIIAGSQRVWFSFNPNKIADELEQWLKFYFVEFLPQLSKTRTPRNSPLRLWRANAVPCPECRRPIVPIAGEVGLRLPDVEAQLAS